MLLERLKNKAESHLVFDPLFVAVVDLMQIHVIPVGGICFEVFAGQFVLMDSPGHETSAVAPELGLQGRFLVVQKIVADSI